MGRIDLSLLLLLIALLPLSCEKGAGIPATGPMTGVKPLYDQTADHAYLSGQAGAQAGYAVASAGDVNGDGYDDLIVGAHYYDNGQTDEGAVFILHGSASGLSTTPDTTIESDQAYTYFGISVAPADDVNGDGFDDIVVGAYLYDHGQTDEGAAFVYLGSAAGIITTPIATIESDQAFADLGVAVAAAGDVNGDGYDDIIVGADSFDNGQTNEGAVFIHLGSASGPDNEADALIESNQAFSFLGRSIAAAGDVNGDGYDDIVIGAYYYDNGETDEGVAFVHFGSPSGIDTTAAATLQADQANAYFGRSVASAGDVNGDGYDDIVIGAYSYDNGQTNEGAAFVYLGSASGTDTTPVATLEPDQASAYFGFSVASAGDVNGDGFDDIIVGSYYYDNGQTNEGAAFLYHGSPDGVISPANALFEQDQVSAEFGICVASAGDVNGDHYDDIVIGAHIYEETETDEGAAFTYHGGAVGSPDDGTCGNAILIGALPFSVNGDLADRTNGLSLYGAGCAAATQDTNDIVYRLSVEGGRTYQMEATPTDAGDIALNLLGACGEEAVCFDSAGAAAVTYTPAQDRTVHIALEGTGTYTLTVTVEEIPDEEETDDSGTPDDAGDPDEDFPPTGEIETDHDVTIDDVLPDEIVIDDMATDDTLIDEEGTDDDGTPLVDDAVIPDDAVPTDNGPVADTDTATPDADTTEPDTSADKDTPVADDEQEDETVTDGILPEEDSPRPDELNKPENDGCGCSLVF